MKTAAKRLAATSTCRVRPTEHAGCCGCSAKCGVDRACSSLSSAADQQPALHQRPSIHRASPLGSAPFGSTQRKAPVSVSKLLKFCKDHQDTAFQIIVRKLRPRTAGTPRHHTYGAPTRYNAAVNSIPASLWYAINLFQFQGLWLQHFETVLAYL
jgi:hypothetical protein